MWQKLDHGWRVLATGWCFFSFSLGGLLMTLTVFPWIRLRWRDRETRRQKTQYAIHRAFKLFIGQMIALRVMDVTLSGAGRLRDAGGVLVLATHPTLIDVVLMISLMPRAECIVKESLHRHPWFGGVVRAADYIANRGAEQLVEDCREAMARGNPLILFPEGTRTTPGQPLQFQRGAAHVIMATGVPVLPVVITCEPPTLTKDTRWYQVPARRFHLRLTVHDALDARALVPDDLAPPLAARQLTRNLQQFFTEAVKA